MKADVRIYSSGIVACSVCVNKDASIEDIEEEANKQNPTGLSHGWAVSKNRHFSGGETNPCQCENDPSRLHYLMEC